MQVYVVSTFYVVVFGGYICLKICGRQWNFNERTFLFSLTEIAQTFVAQCRATETSCKVKTEEKHSAELEDC